MTQIIGFSCLIIKKRVHSFLNCKVSCIIYKIIIGRIMILISISLNYFICKWLKCDILLFMTSVSLNFYWRDTLKIWQENTLSSRTTQEEYQLPCLCFLNSDQNIQSDAFILHKLRALPECIRTRGSSFSFLTLLTKNGNESSSYLHLIIYLKKEKTLKI